MRSKILAALAVAFGATGSALGPSPAEAWGSGGGGGPPQQKVYVPPQTPGQRAMNRPNPKKTVKQPGTFSREAGWGKQPIHGNPSGPGGQNSPFTFHSHI